MDWETFPRPRLERMRKLALPLSVTGLLIWLLLAFAGLLLAQGLVAIDGNLSIYAWKTTLLALAPAAFVGMAALPLLLLRRERSGLGEFLLQQPPLPVAKTLVAVVVGVGAGLLFYPLLDQGLTLFLIGLLGLGGAVAAIILMAMRNPYSLPVYMLAVPFLNILEARFLPAGGPWSGLVGPDSRFLGLPRLAFILLALTWLATGHLNWGRLRSSLVIRSLLVYSVVALALVPRGSPLSSIQITTWDALYPLLFLTLALSVVDTSRKASWLLHSLLVATAISVFMGLFLFSEEVLPQAESLEVSRDLGATYRALGTNINAFAMRAGIAVCIGVGIVFFARGLLPKLLWAAVTGFVFIGFLVSLSIDSWLALGITGLVISLVHPRVRIVAAFLVPISLVLLAWYLLLVAPEGPLGLTIYPGSWRDAITRFDPIRPLYWEAAWRMFLHNPIIGVGRLMFAEAYPVYGDVLPFAITPNIAHNAYLNTLAEMGLIGFVAFLTVIGTILYMGVIALRGFRQQPYYPLVLGAMAGVVFLLVQGLTETGQLFGGGYFPLTLLQWATIAVLAGAWASRDKGAEGSQTEKVEQNA